MEQRLTIATLGVNDLKTASDNPFLPLDENENVIRE